REDSRGRERTNRAVSLLTSEALIAKSLTPSTSYKIRSAGSLFLARLHSQRYSPFLCSPILVTSSSPMFVFSQSASHRVNSTRNVNRRGCAPYSCVCAARNLPERLHNLGSIMANPDRWRWQRERVRLRRNGRYLVDAV